jgi:hypothetical protein
MCGGGGGGGRVFSGSKPKVNPNWGDWGGGGSGAFQGYGYGFRGNAPGAYGQYGSGGGQHGWTGQDGKWRTAEEHKANNYQPPVSGPSPTPGPGPTPTPTTPTPTPTPANPVYWQDLESQWLDFSRNPADFAPGTDMAQAKLNFMNAGGMNPTGSVLTNPYYDPYGIPNG